MTQKVEKIQGGINAKNIEIYSSKYKLFWIEGCGFSDFPQFKCLKYGLYFDNIWMENWWNIDNTSYKYGLHMIEIAHMYQLEMI